MRRASGACLSNGSGAVAVEFAIVGPLMLLLLIGIMEVGRMLWMENALEYAVAEAARCMSINPSVCGTAREVQDYAASSAGLSLPREIFSVGLAPCGSVVTARYAFQFVGRILPYTIVLSAQSCFPR